MKPLLSVIITTYNRSQSVARCLRSVLAQLPDCAEIVVVDDGSTDDTQTILQRDFSVTGVRVVRQQNGGVVAARNRGALESEGEYITYIDSDDEPLADWLEAFVAAIQAQRPAVVCCGTIQVGTRHGAMYADTKLPRERPELGGLKGLFLPGTYAIRRDVFWQLGGMSTGAVSGEHNEFAYRFSLTHDATAVSCIPRTLMISYRQSEDSLRGHSAAVRDGAIYFLEQHRSTLLRRSRVAYARRCQVAVVNSARVGDFANARRYSRLAVAVQPLSVTGYARMVAAHVPPLARVVWGRSV